MKKQFTKIKIAAENLSRSNKPDRKDFELDTIEKQVEKYRDVLDKMVRKLPAVSSSDIQERDKRIKKNSHYKIGQALEESSKELSKEMPLHHVLSNCGDLEKSIAECIVDSELQTETEVVKRLKLILDHEIQEISTHKRNVSRTMQEYASLKRSYEAAIRLDEPQAKVNHIKEQQEQCEIKLEKERDCWAAQMFELIAKEDVIVQCIQDYVLNQRNYHERALLKVNSSLASIQDVIQSTVKSRFGTSLTEHLASTSREISYIIELCVCCLIENGLYEEGLLRVGCASTKMRRMKNALEAQYVKTPLPLDYQDPHVIGSILKLYLRELPEPLLTFKYYTNFIKAIEKPTETERKAEIKAILAKLPKENYVNLRYLTKFLWLVTQNVEQNKMSSQNLAIVMSPNMLWPRMDKQNPADYLGQVNSSSAVNIIVELLINQWDYFFDGEQVEFFVTLQRNRLFVEGKSKSNSSNENLDRSDGDSLESPRYGTIRRQKACAPSPPAKSSEKLQNAVSKSGLTPMETSFKNGDIGFNNRTKELFPAQSSISQTEKPAVVVAEKPEKPPVPKLPQLFLQQQQQQQQQLQQPPEPSPKPVPMTRTQFFGLDNLPSPTADRKSNDSVCSLNSLKPDLPQKPKIPKRPMVLGLNSTAATTKSDEDNTPTSTTTLTAPLGPMPTYENHSIQNLIKNNTDNINKNTVEITKNNAEIIKNNTEGFLKNHTDYSNKNPADMVKNNTDVFLKTNTENSIKHTTEKFIDKLRYENCDNNAIAKENQLTNLETAANINDNKYNESANKTATALATPLTISPASITATTNNTEKHLNVNEAPRLTPTTPLSPGMILTPKRPTVPAPPPPSLVKKQIE